MKQNIAFAVMIVYKLDLILWKQGQKCSHLTIKAPHN